MSRKKFIESQGATCDNWTWSWSFVNHQDKVVIFGAWDIKTNGNTTLIFSKDWEFGQTGNKKPAYKQSRWHISLIEDSGYTLKTFPIIYSNENKDKEGVGPAKIESFSPDLTKKKLKRVGDSWYASDSEMPDTLPEQVNDNELYVEGLAKKISVNIYERCAEARKKCLDHYGFHCSVCSFDFKKFYGDLGEDYIHVHHIVPIAEIRKKYVLDPVKDLMPVCPNCHAMIHRTQPALTIEQLKQYIKNN